MKTNGPGAMLFIIDLLWAVVLSKSGPSLFPKSHDQARYTINWFDSDLSALIKNMNNSCNDQENAKATLFIHSNPSKRVSLAK